MENANDREIKVAKRIAKFVAGGEKTRTQVYRKFGKIGAESLDRALAHATRNLRVRKRSDLSNGCKGEKVFYSKVQS